MEEFAGTEFVHIWNKTGVASSAASHWLLVRIFSRFNFFQDFQVFSSQTKKIRPYVF